MNAPTITAVGGSSTGRNALTDTELALVISAAHHALAEHADTQGVSPSKVARICRKFAKMLCRSRLTFHEFLADKANHRWAQGDPVMLRTISYLDPTGDKASRNVDRERHKTN